MTASRRRSGVVREVAPPYGALLLDTHVWIWELTFDYPRYVPAHVKDRVESQSRSAGVFVSDISYWEIALKAESGRLALGLPTDVLLARAEESARGRPIPVDRRVLLLSTRLHGMHRDPADRLLVATAKLHGLTLVTADKAILSWARKEGRTSVLAAR